MVEQRGRGQLLAHFGATVRKQLPPTTAQCSMNTAHNTTLAPTNKKTCTITTAPVTS